jgi:hypothetical protein
MKVETWTPPASATRWYAGLIGLFLGVRAVTTLLAGASFALPGNGWRAVFQLLAVAVLATGIARDRTAASAVVVGVTYLAATALELVHGMDLLGVVPVDPRDRVVHPLIALAAAACLALDRKAVPDSRGLPSPDA